jgi:multiple sugar transport system substrate-binding protein
MKQKLKSFRTIILAIVAIAMVSASCGGGDKQAEKVTLKIWKPFVDSERMQSVITAYQQKYPNVTIEYTKKNIENYEADLIDALASGNGPDIYSINNTWLPRYIDKITPAEDKNFTLKQYREMYVDVLSNDLVRDGKIYGTAMWVDSLGLYYNKDLLGTAGIATPPKTWTELATDVRKIVRQSEGGYFDRSGVAIGTNTNVNRAVDIVYLLMLQAGAVPWSADGSTPLFANQINKRGQNMNPGVEGVEFYTSFADPSSANYNWNVNSDYSIDAFANGRAAMLYGYSYTRDQINSKAPNLNYDVAPVPQYNLSDPTVNYANYFAEVVSKQSKVSNWAWDFLKFATSKEVLDQYYAGDKQPSSRRDLIELQTQDLEIGVFAHANLTAKSFYKSDEAKFDTIMGDMINNVVLKGMGVEAAVTQAQTQASTLTRFRN